MPGFKMFIAPGGLTQFYYQFYVISILENMQLSEQIDRYLFDIIFHTQIPAIIDNEQLLFWTTPNVTLFITVGATL